MTGCGCDPVSGLAELADWIDGRRGSRAEPRRRGLGAYADPYALGARIDAAGIAIRRHQPSVTEALVDIFNRYRPVTRAAYGGTIDTMDIVNAPLDLGPNGTDLRWEGLSGLGQTVLPEQSEPQLGPLAAGIDQCRDLCRSFLGTGDGGWSFHRCVNHCMGIGEPWPGGIIVKVPWGLGK